MANHTPFRLALAANDAATSYAARNPKATDPSLVAGCFDLGVAPYGWNARAPSFVHIVPFGTAADNKTFAMKVWGWNKVAEVALYVPYLIADLAITLGGTTGTAIATNTFMADTIALTKGIPAGPFSGLNSNANDDVASIILHTLGCQYIDFDFDADAGGTASTDANAYFRLLDFD